jgi:septal ring factor EnvC (AmiA/AmiB activator)
MKLLVMPYLLFVLVFIIGCASNEKELKNEWETHKKDLDKLKLELKKKSDSFQANRSLSEDSSFRKRVEWLTNDIRKIEVKMDTLDAELKRMDKGKKKEEEEEGE